MRLNFVVGEIPFSLGKEPADFEASDDDDDARRQC